MTAQKVELLRRSVIGLERSGSLTDRWDRRDGRRVGDSPDFGWRVAQVLAKRQQLPSFLQKSCYRWVRAAAIYVRLGQTQTRQFPESRIVHSAVQFWNADDCAVDEIRAALFATDSTAQKVADSFGLKAEVVQAINDLFFNVLDRKSDYHYRANILRPSFGRAGQLSGQLSNYECSTSLMNTAFEGTLADVLSASGRQASEDIGASPEMVIRNRALIAASEWARSPEREASPSPLVAFGLEIVRKGEVPESEVYDAGPDLGDFLAEELRRDVDIIRNGINLKIEANLKGIAG